MDEIGKEIYNSQGWADYMSMARQETQKSWLSAARGCREMPEIAWEADGLKDMR